MKKVHIRDYKRTFHGESSTIAYTRCGKQIDFKRDELFTPIDSDTPQYWKAKNVCGNCVRGLKRKGK